jgi:hypothetical protein
MAPAMLANSFRLPGDCHVWRHHRTPTCSHWTWRPIAHGCGDSFTTGAGRIPPCMAGRPSTRTSPQHAPLPEPKSSQISRRYSPKFSRSNDSFLLCFSVDILVNWTCTDVRFRPTPSGHWLVDHHLQAPLLMGVNCFRRPQDIHQRSLGPNIQANRLQGERIVSLHVHS